MYICLPIYLSIYLTHIIPYITHTLPTISSSSETCPVHPVNKRRLGLELSNFLIPQCQRLLQPGPETAVLVFSCY